MFKKSSFNIIQLYAYNVNFIKNHIYTNININNIKYYDLDISIFLSSYFLILKSKKYINIYLEFIAQQIYSKYIIDKNIPFILNINALICGNNFFLLPINNYYLFDKICYEILYAKKIYLFSFGIVSYDSFLLNHYCKKLKLKLTQRKKIKFLIEDFHNNYNFFNKIMINVNKIHGENINSHYFYF